MYVVQDSVQWYYNLQNLQKFVQKIVEFFSPRRLLVFDHYHVVHSVQPFVQCCTTSVQLCTKLYGLYELYNVLYNIVTVWFADGGPVTVWLAI